jgi:hypothetical protein
MSVRHLRGKWEREAGEAHEIPRMQPRRVRAFFFTTENPKQKKQNCQGTSVIPYSRPYWILRMIFFWYPSSTQIVPEVYIMRSIQYGLE